MTALRSNLLMAWASLLVLLVAFGIVTAMAFKSVNRAADHSAHAALTVEICARLESVPQGNAYPKSLSELRLTYPDGGDSSLLSRFTYYSSGTSCTVRTFLRGREFVRTYP